MLAFLEQFHFLRPWWLLAIPPVLALAWLLWRRGPQATAWREVIAPELLNHLLEHRPGGGGRRLLSALAAAWVLACIALAGPTWERLSQPLHQSEAAVVVLLDLSPSMVAQDLQPSRLARARFKLRDYLEAREEGLTALVAYAGDAHVVSPLTDDTDTIASLVPPLEPGIMPTPGSQVERAVSQALELFDNAGIEQGETLLITDGVVPEGREAVREQLDGSRFRLSILGAATEDGAPIPREEGGFVEDDRGNVVVPRFDPRALAELSQHLGGHFTTLSADNSDIEGLLAHTRRSELTSNRQRLAERNFDTWRDAGPWLALLLLPAVALAFRRGWLLSLAGVGLLSLSPDSRALDWGDLWSRSDQQAQSALQQEDPERAAREARDPRWQGSALYRAEEYREAAGAFAEGDEAVDHYNRGNALARAGQLQEALEAYQAALSQQPDFPDAAHNAEVVEELLEQQQEEEQKEQQQQQSQQQQQDGGEPGEQNQSGQGQPQQNAQQNGGNPGEQGDDGDPDQQGREGGDRDSQSAQAPGEPSDGGDESQVNEDTAADLADRDDGDEGREQPSPADTDSDARPGQGETTEGEEAPGDNPESVARRQEEREVQQSLDQWLRQVPDDPGGLLRRKFEYQHRQRDRERAWSGSQEPERL